MELFKASRQWAERPADQRFETLEALQKATQEYAAHARTSHPLYGDLRVEVLNDDVALVGKGATPARFTHWAFGQLCNRMGAPASYMRELPATLAVQNLNYGLKNKAPEGKAELLFHTNGSLLVRAFTSDKYTRIWNHEVASRLIPLTRDYGWRTPPARPAMAGQPGTRLATKEDVLNDQGFGLSVRVGDEIAPAGIYASDHDMFVFLINEKYRVDDGSDQGMSRGVFIENSEVGASALKVTRFLLRHVCGNHIVWGAKGVTEVSVKHVGAARSRMNAAFKAELISYANESVSDEEARIKQAKKFYFGKDKEAVLDALFGKRSLALPKKRLEEAFESTENHPEDGDPTTAWGMAQGLTRVSQSVPYADQRADLDRAAGKVLEMAF